MNLVVDATVLAEGLIDSGPSGSWALGLISGNGLAAPELALPEVATVLRRALRTGTITEFGASAAHRDLIRLPIVLFGYRPFGDRIWALRETVTPYDAWYVALAESLGVPLATLDLRLSRAPGPRCEFLMPPA